jgi:uncharacterized protein
MNAREALVRAIDVFAEHPAALARGGRHHRFPRGARRFSTRGGVAVGRRAHSRAAMSPTTTRRRITRTIGALVAIGSLTFLYAWQVEPRRLHVQHDTIAHTGVPTLTLGVIADLHHGMHPMNDARVRRVVDTVNTLHADAIVLLGDYHATSSFADRLEPEQTARLLAALHARLGVYAVLGNHDHWLDAPRTEAALRSVGITVLENRGVLLPGTNVWLAGIADDFSSTPSEAHALRGCPPDARVIAITHSPDVWPRLSERINVTLAGHTHGGQIRIPLYGAPWVPSHFGERFLRGVYRQGTKALYVSSGVGQSIAPLRFNVVPEVNLLTLRP